MRHHLITIRARTEALTRLLKELGMSQEVDDLTAAVNALSQAVDAATAAMTANAHDPAAVEGAANTVNQLTARLNAATASAAAPAPVATAPVATPATAS